MDYSVEFAADAERDFEILLEFLAESYIAFGDRPAEAIDRARARVQAVRTEIEALGRSPHRGTGHDDLFEGLRHVTLGRAIVWFDIDKERRAVRVLAVFYGGEDHIRRMLRRLGG